MASRLSALLVALALLLTGCGGDPESAPLHEVTSSPDSDESPTAHASDDGHHDVAPVPAKPLRRGERRAELKMTADYTPSAPYGTGTDDYRCFLLDPGLTKDTWLTGTHVRPGNPDVVHHVILFRVRPDQLERARAVDAADDGDGWTCFGGSGIEEFQNVDDADWLGAWAPGGDESVTKKGYGVRLEAGTQIVMQVHYNLLAGSEPDRSATLLRLAPGTRPMESLHTMLLPAPVELPCRPEHADGPLCDRDAAMADVKERFGDKAGRTGDLLHWLCGTEPKAGERQSCTRPLMQPMTIHGVAAHMHLLGRQIRIETNPGTPQAKTVLNIPVWDFDDQGSRPIDPVSLKAGETVRVTCRHVQWLRDQLPAFEGQPDRYVVWGEGTTDEMCLGMLQVTRP